MRRYTLNKYISRLMACLMVLAMLVPLVPAAWAAEPTVPPTESQPTTPATEAPGEETEPAGEVSAATEGTCGTNLSWSFDTGTLTISGSGEMNRYSENERAPWYHLRKDILRLELPEGLTTIGALAFYGCEELTVVSIPDSVQTVGEYAFYGCSGISMLTLGNGVTAIGESAFAGCTSFYSLRLPDNLQTISTKAFYRCESLTTITVPASVTYIGNSAFGYCKGLINADIQASISSVPEWMFYGCERLTTVVLPDALRSISKFSFRGCDSLCTVYYNGSQMHEEEIREMINEDVPAFDGTGHITDDTPAGPSSSGSTEENDDGSIIQENVSTVEEEDLVIITRTETEYDEEGNGSEADMEIIVTVEDDAAWDDAIDYVDDAIRDYTEGNTERDTEGNPVEIEVHVTDDTEIDQDFINSLTGRDVVITFITEDGSIWRIDGTALDDETMAGAYNLRYTLTTGSRELGEELGTDSCYILKFSAPAQINAEVLIRLGSSLALQNATLFQRADDELSRFQTVVVDWHGYAHLYLGSVESDVEYYIAMNLPAEGADTVVPGELLSAYGSPESYTPIQYQITGRKSSWNMTIGQVTWIMVGVLTVVVAVVGFTMYSLNKRKLAMGYIPDWDDDDE